VLAFWLIELDIIQCRPEKCGCPGQTINLAPRAN